MRAYAAFLVFVACRFVACRRADCCGRGQCKRWLTESAAGGARSVEAEMKSIEFLQLRRSGLWCLVLESQRRGVLAESSERKSSSSGMDLTNHIATPRTIAATMQWPPSPAPEQHEQQEHARRQDSGQACDIRRESEHFLSPVRR